MIHSTYGTYSIFDSQTIYALRKIFKFFSYSVYGVMYVVCCQLHNAQCTLHVRLGVSYSYSRESGSDNLSQIQVYRNSDSLSVLQSSKFSSVSSNYD